MTTDQNKTDDSKAEDIREDKAEVTEPVNGRPASQVEAERGARDSIPPADPELRAAERASAADYARKGIIGAPGSEVPAAPARHKDQDSKDDQAGKDKT